MRSPTLENGASVRGRTGWDPVHEARASFIACLRAFSSPGREVPDLPRAGLTDDDELDRAAAVLLGLLDHATTLAAVGHATTSKVADVIRGRTGAPAAEVERATFVLAGPGASDGVAERTYRGTALEPHLGATVVYTARGSTPVRLLGPGLEEPLDTHLSLTAGEIASLRRANASAPTGIDVLVVAAHALTGLPRSTRIEG